MADRRKQLLDDSTWDEVRYINNYAVFMGYVSMAIKGLGFLVITWTTVVLLGGFVSMLHRKDFWCLTFITLVQTAGIFDAVLNEKLGYVNYSGYGLIMAVLAGVMGNQKYPGHCTPAIVARFLVAFVLLVVQLLVLVPVLCLLQTVYTFGILMSGGISLWRLIEHDYGRNSDGEASNLAPAMDTLYYLALLQGVIFCYWFVLGCSGKGLAKELAFTCDESELELVYNYLHETRIGCEKDPSFIKGRNLVTHAIAMIGSSSPVDCISGVKMLYTAICIGHMRLQRLMKGSKASHPMQRDIVRGQRMLIKHLAMYASSSRPNMLQKLLEMLDSTGLHDIETRNQAAAIVEYLASNINLEEFPRGIQCISSMIGTFEQYNIAEPYQRNYLCDEYGQYRCDMRARSMFPSPVHSGDDAGGKLRKSYKGLLLHGLSILGSLVVNENNCRVIINTGNLVSRIMAPVTCDLLHHTPNDHGAWSEIVHRSMYVMGQLSSTPGETGSKARQQISSCQGAISTLWRILNCNECNEKLQLSSFYIFIRLYLGTECSSTSDFVVLKKESSSIGREDFVRMLVEIFTHDDKSVLTREDAGEALSVLCFRDGITDATIVIQQNGDVPDSLTKVLLHDMSTACKQRAAEILEHLCTHYTKDDEYLGKLKKSMNGVMTKVIEKILLWGDKTHTETDGFSKKETDIENQCDNDQGKGISSSSPSQPQNDEKDKEEKAFQRVVQSVKSVNLLSSLLSLCGAAYDKFFGDLAPQLGSSSFLNKLKEIIVEKSDHPTVENLLLIKIITKVVISMMKHGGGRFAKEDLRSLIEALSSAWMNMMDLDYSMVFRSGERKRSCDTTSWKLDRCTLASLVKEAQDLHAKLPSTSGNTSG